MNRNRLRELGFELGAHAGGRSQGAWFATTSDGAQVVLKWSSETALLERYAALLPALDALRARGVPVPEYLQVIRWEGGTLSAQTRLPGRPERNPPRAVVESLVRCVAAQAGLGGPAPAAGLATWGEFVVRALRVGVGGWAVHEPLRTWDRRSARVLDRALAIGAAIDADAFPDGGLVHLDLHTDNVLVADGALSGIMDWEGACAGDPRYDLVQLAFDLDGHGQPSWEVVDALGFAPEVLRAYVAVLTLKCTSSAMVHRPDDVARQLDRAERVFDRYDV